MQDVVERTLHASKKQAHAISHTHTQTLKVLTHICGLFQVLEGSIRFQVLGGLLSDRKRGSDG